MKTPQEIAFEIIASVGTARSLYIEAIEEAKQGNFEAADEKVKEGQEYFNQGHGAHFSLVSQAADEKQPPVDFDLFLMHAEDQLMSAETFGILAQQFIDLYKIVLK